MSLGIYRVEDSQENNVGFGYYRGIKAVKECNQE
jgi:hypothetical protein